MNAELANVAKEIGGVAERRYNDSLEQLHPCGYPGSR